jgi:polar amino acid transport system substrate-binding protein
VLVVVGYGTLALLAQRVEVPAASNSDTFRWGGDRTGGGPYIFEDESGELTGFEVELAGYLAEQLGQRAEFVKGSWDKLPARLSRGDFDIVLNGYEWTAEREKMWASTLPYYIYTLQLLARTDDEAIRSWEDLRTRRNGRRLRVGVLSASAAQRYLRREFGDDVEVLAYSEGVTSALRLVENGQLDASVQDLPAACFYAQQFPGLHPVGKPRAPGYYVMFVRRESQDLRQRLNEAIRHAYSSGKLEAIYRRFNIWTPEQEHLPEAWKDWPPQTEAEGSVGPAWAEQLATLSWAALTTVLLSCLSMPLAILLGLLVAVGRLYGPPWLGWPLAGYVEFLRGTPLLLQLFVIFFLLPEVDIRLPAFWAGVLGLAINYSAYEAENYRAGLLAIPKGQMEAALALGMSTWTALRRVIVPQAVRIVIPPVTNDFIALFKDTSVCSVIAVTELTGRYSELYNDFPSQALRLGLMTATLYLLMSYPLSLVARRLEQRFPKVMA